MKGFVQCEVTLSKETKTVTVTAAAAATVADPEICPRGT